MNRTERVYATECLDTACWLGVLDYKVQEVRSLGTGRTAWVFLDPQGTAEADAVRFMESELAKGLSFRRRLLALAKGTSTIAQFDRMQARGRRKQDR